MKRILIAIAMVAAVALPIRAASTAAVAADNFFGKAWKDVQANSSFHFLDNLTPGAFYDFKEHTMMAGGTTSVYMYRAISLDGGVVKSIDDQANQNASAIPIVGLNFHGGTLIHNSTTLTKAVDTAGFNQGLLKYLTAGAWTGRDFAEHITRYGVYGGFLVLFQ